MNRLFLSRRRFVGSSLVVALFGASAVNGVLAIDGDSNTANADQGTVLAAQKWPYQLGSLKGSGHTISNVAVAGATEGHAGFDAAACIGAIMLGTNTLRSGGGTAATVIANVTAQVAAMRTAGIKRMLVITPPNADAIDADATLLAEWNLYADRALAGAIPGADRVLDLRPHVFTLQSDRLHLTVADQLALAGLVTAELNSLL